MTTTARSIIELAHIQLSDIDGVRWPARELVMHLNAAQLAYVEQRPDQKCITAPVTLAAGFLQTIPAEALSLMDIPANATGRRRPITKVEMVQLDAVLPDWRAKAPAAEVIHFMHDLREPRRFRVYPPALPTVQVDMTYSLYPTDVPVSADQITAASVTGNIDLPDHARDALLNYVLYKAYSKDAEFGGNATMAASYLALFNAAVGSQLQTTGTVAPKT